MKPMKYKILVVDDEPVNLRLLERLFRRSHEVVTAESGAEALKVLEAHHVALIISDQRMPGMTGIEFLKQAAELRPKTVRIILTGYTDVNDLVEAINSGVIYKYITKPWSNENLLQTVTRGLEYYEAFKERHDLLQQNARLTELSETIQAGFIDLISETIRTIDSTWPERRDRMLDQAGSLGDWLELGREDSRTLTHAVKLSEIGRLNVAETDEKPVAGRSDSNSGFWIDQLDGIPEMTGVCSALRLRHEDHNASQLSGEEIPLLCRILSVVTAFDSALCAVDGEMAEREMAAMNALERGSGTEFDPKVVDALKVIRSMESTLANTTVAVADQISSDRPN